jgi:hypothetical protein
MIWESYYWKEPLLKSASYLSRVSLNERTKESTYVRIEKEVFSGFYVIRKLIEAQKVTDETKQMSFTLRHHPAVRRVDHLNWHHIDQNYDLTRSGVEERDLIFLCNQFIHSYLFLAAEYNDRLDGIFVASDRTRHTKCYFVTINQVLKAFRAVGRSYPSASLLLRGAETGQWGVYQT